MGCRGIIQVMQKMYHLDSNIKPANKLKEYCAESKDLIMSNTPCVC